MPDIITNIGEVTDYEVFPGSASQEENWTDSVCNHDNESFLVNALCVGLIICHSLIDI